MTTQSGSCGCLHGVWYIVMFLRDVSQSCRLHSMWCNLTSLVTVCFSCCCCSVSCCWRCAERSAISVRFSAATLAANCLRTSLCLQESQCAAAATLRQYANECNVTTGTQARCECTKSALRLLSFILTLCCSASLPWEKKSHATQKAAKQVISLLAVN